jgi:Flp pilus assembly protein TadG
MLGPTFWKHFWRDTEGAVLPLATIMLVVFVGGGLLAIDASRYMDLQTQLQKAADAAALAAAAELDRKPTAISRANLAVQNLVSNRQVFGEGVPNVQVATRFLASLPASDNTPIPAASVTADPKLARFVEVTVNPTTLNTVFPATFMGAATNTAVTSAVAVAGFDSVACKFTPVYICNPYEGLGEDFLTIAKTPSFRRRLLQITSEPGGAAYPGNFGYLSPPTGQGNPPLEDMLAAVNPGACFRQNGVETRTGNPSVEDALNVRFDLFRQGGGPNSYRNNPAYPPAANVRKGYKIGTGGTQDACKQEAAYNTEVVPSTDPVTGADPSGRRGLTRDTCFYPTTAAGTPNPSYPCTLAGADASVQGRVGDGNWDLTGYMKTNHNDVPSSNWPPSDSSRYEVYLWEIANSRVSHASTGGETGTKFCSSVPATATPDRRILYGAVINCRQNAALLNGGSGEDIPVLAFAKFFLTEPAQGETSGRKVIWAELVDIIEPGDDDGVLRDQVQLYR